MGYVDGEWFSFLSRVTNTLHVIIVVSLPAYLCIHTYTYEVFFHAVYPVIFLGRATYVGRA